MNGAGQRGATLLLVEDEEDLRWVLATLLEEHGYRVLEAGSAEEAVAVWRRRPADAVVTDLRMPGASGLELMRRLRAEAPRLPFVFISAMEDVATAVEAIREGAWDYLTKPFDNERLLAVVARALEHADLTAELESLRRAERNPPSFGCSSAAEELARTLGLVARAPELTVLIEGESGTGKEVFARAVHDLSPRAAGPFLALDCGALPEELVESLLFGHVKGAFTGADRDRKGLFREADGGTLLLDEVGNLSPGLQVKLLRCLEEREVRPLGSAQSVAFDVRLLSATNEDLERRVEGGGFRLDLYHRLAEFKVRIPPLRERTEDLRWFANLFLTEAAEELGRRPPELDDEAWAALAAHGWPGNLRELRNHLRRCLLLHPGPSLGAAEVAPHPGKEEAVPAAVPSCEPPAELPLRERIRRATEALEARWIEEALRAAGGNKAEAARRLGIDYTTLHRKLRRFGRPGRPG